ncbi:helix-turn-helix domain-containing protein [Nannocystis sp. ILAH1]|uniref:helix-turn-helix domain-containing protein n=1 Tax=Nannocystis sp. ILAH1 TaxID=2996789 RepID=UPI002271BAC7|nr:helix-turn-helix domain-containing protein [Nannocystis sp. ILAH1]MCY0985995.1 helix-turn-helix domain-containing protein [Nannocystis sp. ILAH1]
MPRHLYALDLEDGPLLLLSALYGYADADEHAAALRGEGAPAFVWPTWGELMRIRRVSRPTVARHLRQLVEAGQIRRATRTVAQLPDRARAALAHAGVDHALLGWELTPSPRVADEAAPALTPTRSGRRGGRREPATATTTAATWSREVGSSRLSIELADETSVADDMNVVDETVAPTTPCLRRDGGRVADETADVSPTTLPAPFLPPNPPPTHAPQTHAAKPTTTTTDASTSAGAMPVETTATPSTTAERQDRGDTRPLSGQAAPQASPYRARVVARRPIADEQEVDDAEFARRITGAVSSILLESFQLFTPRDATNTVQKGRRVKSDSGTTGRIKRLLTPPDAVQDADRAAWLKEQVALVLEYVRAFADLCQAEQRELTGRAWKFEDTRHLRWWDGMMFETQPLAGKRKAPWDMVVKAVDDARAAKATESVGAELKAAEVKAQAAVVAAEEAKPRVDVSVAAADFLRTLGPPTKTTKLAPPRPDELKDAGDDLAALREFNKQRRAGASFDAAAAGANKLHRGGGRT